jgi:hypothetical protein
MTENSVNNALPNEAQRIVPIREKYDGALLPFSYTLKLDATIIDRRSKKELHSVIGAKAVEVGNKLLAIHPSGGRLRISQSGLVLGFEDDRWVVIGAVSASEWFATSENLET